MRFTPPKLPPGEYPLRVELRSGAEEPTRSAPASVFLVEPQTREAELLWTDLRWLAKPSTEQPAAVASAGVERPANQRTSNRGRRLRRLANTYRKVLATLAEGSPAAARDALFELESEALGRDSGGKQMELLLAAQLQIARQLAEKDPDSLIPAFSLHYRLHDSYSQRRLYSLIFHARSAIEILLEAYVRAGGSPTVAAAAVAGLAGHLQRANLPGSCRRLFRRALDYDPLHPGAALGLAASYEKYGEYGRAIELLEPLAEARPEHSEALLRLAVNHRRTGILKRSRDLLTAVTVQSGPAWVRSLAYQQLAREHLAAGALDEAAGLLEAALEKMPEEAGIAMLLAHVYDRTRRSPPGPGAGLRHLSRRRQRRLPRFAAQALRHLAAGGARSRAGDVGRER